MISANRNPKPTAHADDGCQCLPCDIPPLCRNNYFTGKLLTERDFKAEQRYLIDALRLHQLELHGWGVVCGLKLKPHPYCPELRLVVEPGFAIDRCGRQIYVPAEVEIELPKPQPAAPVKDACPPEPPAPADSSQQGKPNGEPTHGDQPVPCLEAKLYICLRYAECETEMMPAPFDECACNGNSQKPNRICESYRIEVLTEQPEGFAEICKHLDCDCEVEDCKELYQKMLGPCLKPSKLACIPLAVISNYEPGKAVTEGMIDNWECRPRLPSMRLLDELIRCILRKLPTRCLTRIVDMNWTHGRDYTCYDFFNLFVGDAQTPKCFEITFERAVRTDGLSARSFRATVVRKTEKGRDGGFLEAVPARVWSNSDGTRFFLQIDPEYVHCLEGIEFDLYLTLQSDVILDTHGYPVDGDLLARLAADNTYVVAPPTGDSIPGGTFESWIRVTR